MSEKEIGTCSICDAVQVPVSRKYYYYNIKCMCCNDIDSAHFEICYHCEFCVPKPPSTIKVNIKPIST